MKYAMLIWSGLSKKKLRTCFTVLSIVLAFLLYGSLHGIVEGFNGVIDQMGEKRLRVMSRVSVTQLLPIAHRARIERLPGVPHVATYAYFGGYYRDPKNSIDSGAVDVENFFTVFPEWKIPPAQLESMQRTRTGVIVGANLAAKYEWRVGDRIPLHSALWVKQDGTNEWTFDVVGIYHIADDPQAGNELYINYAYFDEARLMDKGTASQFMVSIASASQAGRIAQAIDNMFANSPEETITLSEKSFLRAQLRKIGDVSLIVNSIVGAVFFALLFLTGNTMAESVRERTGEFAVLKAVGFSDAFILWLVVAEATITCVLSAVAGLAIAAAVFPGIFRAAGIGSVYLPTNVAIQGLAFATLLALISAGLPAWRAGRLSVAKALTVR